MTPAIPAPRFLRSAQSFPHGQKNPQGKVIPAREPPLVGRQVCLGNFGLPLLIRMSRYSKELLSTEPPAPPQALLTVPGGTAHGGLALELGVMVMSPLSPWGDSNWGGSERSPTTPTLCQLPQKRGLWGPRPWPP